MQRPCGGVCLMCLRARVRVAGNEVIHGSLQTMVRASKFILRETESHARVLVRGGRCSHCSFQKLTAATGRVDQRGQSRPVRRHLGLQWGTFTAGSATGKGLARGLRPSQCWNWSSNTGPLVHCFHSTEAAILFPVAQFQGREGGYAGSVP